MNSQELAQAVQEFATIFRNNTYDFLYEADLRTCLATILLEKTKNHRIVINATGNPRDSREYHPEHRNLERIETTPVKVEYPMRPGREKMDIGILSQAFIQENLPGVNVANPFWSQPVQVAIELKYYQQGDPLNGNRGKLTLFYIDIDRLVNYRDNILPTKCDNPPYNVADFIGVAILCFQAYYHDPRITRDQISRNPYTVVDGIQPINSIGGYVLTTDRLYTVQS